MRCCEPCHVQTEQDQLLQHITGVVSDDLLVQLLTSWLQAQALTEDTTQDAALTAYANNLGPQHTVNTASGSPADQGTSHCAQCDREASNGRQGSKGSKAAGDVGPARDVHRPPIREVLHIHRTICYALVEFASEARQLQQRSDVTAQQMESLVERHRWEVACGTVRQHCPHLHLGDIHRQAGTASSQQGASREKWLRESRRVCVCISCVQVSS